MNNKPGDRETIVRLSQLKVLLRIAAFFLKTLKDRVGLRRESLFSDALWLVVWYAPGIFLGVVLGKKAACRGLLYLPFPPVSRIL